MSDAHVVRFDEGEHGDGCWGPGPADLGCERPPTTDVGLCGPCRHKIESRRDVPSDDAWSAWAQLVREARASVSFTVSDDFAGAIQAAVDYRVAGRMSVVVEGDDIEPTVRIINTTA